MSCATATLKFTAFVMNILCCIFGALMLSASAYALVNFNNSDAIRIPCIVGVALGGLLLAATVVGCCGTIRESHRTICAYAIFLLLLLCAQIAVIFLLSVDFKQLAVETINNAWTRQLSDDVMATYEINYDCCGKNGPNDYIENGLMLPASCYLNQKPSIANDLYTDGCYVKLADAFSRSARIEVISDWLLVGVEGVTILVACVLGISFKNVERRKLYH